MPEPSRRRAARLALVGAALLVSLLLVEGLARLLGEDPSLVRFSIRGVPTRQVGGVTLWSHRTPRADADAGRRAAADPGALRILALGDSITYGVGLAASDTYPERLRAALTARTGRRVEVLNLAVPGYNTAQQNAAYAEVASTLRPDVVLLQYWQDDVRQHRVLAGHVVDTSEVAERDGQLVVQVLPVPPAVNDLLVVHSRLYGLLTRRVAARRIQAQPLDWSRVAVPLAEIAARAQRDGAAMLILASPDLGGETALPPAGLAELRQSGAAAGVEVLDVSDWLQGIPARQIAMDSCHFNAEGHRLVGERLADHLVERGWVR